MTTKPQIANPLDDPKPSVKPSSTDLVEPAIDSQSRERVDLGDLKRKSVRGGAITLVSQAVSTVVHLASTVILARMLTPADYGIIAMVTAITSFAGLFRDLGLSSAAIQKKDLTPGQQTNLFWLNVAMGAALTIIVAGCSPLVSWFYGKPELTAVTISLSFNFLIGSFGAQHGAMLVRNMQFERRAVAGISAGVLSLIVALMMAYKGYSYWALVASSLTGSFVTTFFLCILSPFWPDLPKRRQGVKDMLSFGANITAFNLVNYFHRNLDNILIGKFIGSAELGFYSRAYALLMFPINSIRGPINAVAFPSLSKLQWEHDSFSIYCKKVVLLTSFLSMPIVMFVGLTSGRLVNVALGPGWEVTANLFSILSVAAFFQPVGGIRGQIMLALGHHRKYLKWGLVNALVTVIGMIIGISWGVTGVAVAYSLTATLVFIPSIVYALDGTPLKAREFFIAISSPVILTLIAGLIFQNVHLIYDELKISIYLAIALDFAFFFLIFGCVSLISKSVRVFWQEVAIAAGSLHRNLLRRSVS